MSRKEYCIRWAAEGNEKCGLSDVRVRELKQWINFIDDHVEFSTFSEDSLKPLIREQDPEIKQKVISLVESAGKEKVMNYGSNSKMKQAIRRAKQRMDKENLESDITEEPIEGKYNTILIDPPWDYGDNDNERGGTTYDTLTLDELKKIELPVSENCTLFLWAVDKFYCEAKELMKEWGFTYKTTLIWNKEWWGVGYFVRPQHEYLLLGIRGKVKPKATDVASVFSEKRGKHSEKPQISYEIIEKMSYEPRKEIFGRKERVGWK